MVYIDVREECMGRFTALEKGMSNISQRRRERSFLTAAGGIQEEFIHPSPPLTPLVQGCWVGWRGPLPSKWTNIEGEGSGEVSIH